MVYELVLHSLGAWPTIPHSSCSTASYADCLPRGFPWRSLVINSCHIIKVSVRGRPKIRLRLILTLFSFITRLRYWWWYNLPALLLYVHIKCWVLFISCQVVRILSISIAVSPCRYHIASILRSSSVGPGALPSRLSEVAIININDIYASAIGLIRSHVHLIFFLTSYVVSLPICSVGPRIRVLLIILVLLQKHHSLFTTRYDYLTIVRSFRARVRITVGTHLHVNSLRKAIGRYGSLCRILDGQLIARFGPQTSRLRFLLMLRRRLIRNI
jgi:hypothetical protein